MLYGDFKPQVNPSLLQHYTRTSSLAHLCKAYNTYQSSYTDLCLVWLHLQALTLVTCFQGYWSAPPPKPPPHPNSMVHLQYWLLSGEIKTINQNVLKASNAGNGHLFVFAKKIIYRGRDWTEKIHKCVIYSIILIIFKIILTVFYKKLK